MTTIYLAQVSSDLIPYRQCVQEELQKRGVRVIDADFQASPNHSVDSLCTVQLTHADWVVSLIAWQKGVVFGPDRGGDGKTALFEHEIRCAEKLGKRILYWMAKDDWPGQYCDLSDEGRAYIENLRNGLNRVAHLFSPEPAPYATFRADLGVVLLRWLHPLPSAPSAPVRPPSLKPTAPLGPLPLDPYPLLLHYEDPRTFGGRSEDIAELIRHLSLPQSLVGFCAPSGAGKSSLLVAGLLPQLRHDGVAVSYDRDPTQPGIWGRLLAAWFTEVPPSWQTAAPNEVVEALLAVYRQTNKPPVLVIDQVEEVLRSDHAHKARQQLGRLLAISSQTIIGVSGPLCRWVLSYRQEYHGDVDKWLAQVVDQNEPGYSDLPFLLNGPHRWISLRLPLLGDLSASPQRRLEVAQTAFLEAIETPLLLTDPTTGQSAYPWRFLDNGAQRLAKIFAEARLAHPDAPLGPELQVVLGHLLNEARVNHHNELHVAENTDTDVVMKALRDHVHRGLKEAFPNDRLGGVREKRTCALLALRELTHDGKRRADGVDTAILERMLAPEGKKVLAALAQPDRRLVMELGGADGTRWVLPHDRLAEVVVEIAENPGIQAELGIDPVAFELRRLVATQVELWKMGEVDQATVLSADRYRQLRQYGDALWVDEDRKQWWTAARSRFLWKRFRLWALAVGAVAAVVATVWGFSAWDQQRDRDRWLQNINSGAPKAVVAALDALADKHSYSDTDLQAALGIRDGEFLVKLFDQGSTAVAESNRGRAVLAAARAAVPSLRAMIEPRKTAGKIGVELKELEVFGAVVATLDYHTMGNVDIAEQAQWVREQVLLPLWDHVPKPTETQMKEWKIEWIRVPQEGNRVTFVMGSPDDDAVALSHERPARTVHLSPYEMMSTEVTVDHVKQLVSDYTPTFDERGLPAHDIHWYQAYGAAAWLGGRLPTEAEWECAARAGTSTAYWFEDARHTDELKDVPCEVEGSENWTPTEQTLCKTAWFDKNADGTLHKVRTRHHNAWGFYDLYGNVYEWTADGYESYSKDEVTDPKGPEAGSGRVIRGGGIANSAVRARSADRNFSGPRGRVPYLGFRVVRSAPARP